MLQNLKQTKKILKELQCPVCGSVLDLLDYRVKAANRGYNYGCSKMPIHYIVRIINWHITTPKLDQEMVTVTDDQHMYQACRVYADQANYIILWVFQIDPEQRIIEGSSKKAIQLPDSAIDFRKVGASRLLNRIRTLLTFQ